MFKNIFTFLNIFKICKYFALAQFLFMSYSIPSHMSLYPSVCSYIPTIAFCSYIPTKFLYIPTILCHYIPPKFPDIPTKFPYILNKFPEISIKFLYIPTKLLGPYIPTVGPYIPAIYVLIYSIRRKERKKPQSRNAKQRTFSTDTLL